MVQNFRGFLDNPDFAGAENPFDFAVEQGKIEEGAESLNTSEGESMGDLGRVEDGARSLIDTDGPRASRRLRNHPRR